MSILAKFAGTPLSAAIGWTVLHSIWEGALIAVVLAIALALTRSPRLRYVAACAAIVAMLGAFALTIAQVLPEQGSGQQSLRIQSYLHWKIAVDTQGYSSWTMSLQSVAPWLGPFWLLGMWLVCALRLTNWLAAQRLRTRGVCYASEYWQGHLARLRNNLGVTTAVTLVESCLADVPMLLGHFRPLILMPIGLLSGLPAGQVEAVLLHELAHIKRRDYLVNMIQRLAEGILFYHPAAWWVSHVIRVERENCCDDLVVSVTRNPH